MCRAAHPRESSAFWLFALVFSGLQPQEDGDGKVFCKVGAEEYQQYLTLLFSLPKELLGVFVVGDELNLTNLKHLLSGFLLLLH